MAGKLTNGHSNGVASELSLVISAVRDALADLHRRLVDASQRSYEKSHGRVSGPGELLRLLTQDEHFAWLRQLSELLADLDALAAEEATMELAAEVRGAVDSLVMPPAGEPHAFWGHYSPLLQENPEVAVAHGQVRKLLTQLPPPAQNGAKALRERHQQALAKKRR